MELGYMPLQCAPGNRRRKMVPSVERWEARLVPKMVVLEGVVKQAREAADICQGTMRTQCYYMSFALHLAFVSAFFCQVHI